jgi:hypothetical protein
VVIQIGEVSWRVRQLEIKIQHGVDIVLRGGVGHGSTPFFSAGGGFQLAFAHAVALTLDQGDIGVVGEAVQQSGDDGGVGEDGIPVFEGTVGGDQQGAAFVAGVDDFVEQVGGLGVIGKISDFVEA